MYDLSYTSLNFILFVAVTAVLYFSLPLKKHKWTILLAASYFFYCFVGYKYVAFILLTTLSTYGIALWVEAYSKKSKQFLKQNKADWDKDKIKAFKNQVKIRKRLILSIAVVLNIGILAFLKYYNFFAGSLNDLLGSFGISMSVPSLRLFLPLGISFYTFQSVGYVVDVYREKISAEKNPAKVALFVSFFPQIVQGPISFYDQLAHQLYEPHAFDFTRFKHACELILWGFFKKLVIADRAVIAINAVTEDYGSFSGTTLLFIVVLYALQLYADFSGGIDISRGVAQIFGIDLAENFKRPYFAKSINEYWRRWHITLGAWMKEYVFYPIAMSKQFTNLSKFIRKSKLGQTATGIHIAKVLPTSIASLIVFFLVGVWHGANWKYVAFGIWNGGIIMISTLLAPVFEKVNKKLHINSQSLWFRLFQMLRTFIVVLIGYVFDVAPNFTDAMRTFRLILTDIHLSTTVEQVQSLGLFTMDFVLLTICTLVLFAVSIIQEKRSDASLRQIIDQKHFLIRLMVLAFGILVLLTFGVYGPAYDPASFVYMQF